VNGGEFSLKKTKVRVYFSLFGDTFPLDDVSKSLEITPTAAYSKGESIPHSTAPRFRKETAWVIDTGYQESLDVNEQLQQIVTQLRGKALIINEMKQIHSMECKFSIVIKIEEGHTPALYLDKSIIKFTSSIEAEFDIDLYTGG
jgi:hypothetical protein